MQENDGKLQQTEGGIEETSENTKGQLEESTPAEPKLSQEVTSENEEEEKARERRNFRS